MVNPVVFFKLQLVMFFEGMRSEWQQITMERAIRTRQVWVELLFAEAKEWHGLRWLRLQGLLNANIQGLLTTVGQNLKRFLAATGSGQQHAPCAGASWTLRPNYRGFHSSMADARSERNADQSTWSHSRSHTRVVPPKAFFQQPEPLCGMGKCSARFRLSRMWC